mgnify:FL=1
MKVLILSCNTGGGHNAAASALKESLNFYHHEAEVLDLMSLGRKHTSALVGGAYVKLVSVFPAGFGALYQLGELVRNFPGNPPFTMQMRGLEMCLQIILIKTILMPLSPHIFIRRKH